MDGFAGISGAQGTPTPTISTDSTFRHGSDDYKYSVD
jgi:hypothetical protein